MRKTPRRIQQTVDGYSFPDFAKITSEVDIVKAINYANYVYEFKEMKEFAKRYTGKSLSKIPDHEFRHYGIICWLLENGCKLPETSISNMQSGIEKLEKLYTPQEVAQQKQETLKPSNVTDKLIGELEGWVDDCLYSSTKSSIQDIIALHKGYSKQDCVEWFMRQVKCIQDDEECIFFDGSKRKRAQALEPLTNVINALNAEKSFKKKASTAIKKTSRQKSPTMIVKKLKYLKTFEEFGLKSIAPEKIIGSTSVWIYNTKTRKLYNYVSESGMTVKNSRLFNYVQEKSVVKTLRTPKEQLQALCACSKVEQRKFMDTIKTKGAVPNGSVNQDMIIVKVY